MQISPAYHKTEIKADIFSTIEEKRLPVVRSILHAALTGLKDSLETNHSKRINAEFCEETVESLSFIHRQMDAQTSANYFKLVMASIFKKCEDRLLLLNALELETGLSNDQEVRLEETDQGLTRDYFTEEVLHAFILPELSPSNVQLVRRVARTGDYTWSQVMAAFAEKLGVKSLQSKNEKLEAFWQMLRDAEESITLQDALTVMNKTCRLYVWTALAKTFAKELSTMGKDEVQLKIKSDFRITQKRYTKRFKLQKNIKSQVLVLKFDPLAFEKSVDFLDIILFKFFFPHKMMKEAAEFMREFEEKATKDSEIKENNSKPLEMRYLAYQIAVYGLTSIIAKELKYGDTDETVAKFAGRLREAGSHYGFEIEDIHNKSKMECALELEFSDSTTKALICLEACKGNLTQISQIDVHNDYTSRLQQLEQILKEVRHIETTSKPKLTQRRRRELERTPDKY